MTVTSVEAVALMIAVEVGHPPPRFRVVAKVQGSEAAGGRIAGQPLEATMICLGETMVVRPNKGKMTIGAMIVSRKAVAGTFLRNPNSTMKSKKNLTHRNLSRKACKN